MAEIEPLLRADALLFIFFLVLGGTTVWSCLPHFLICALSVCLSVCLRLFSSKTENSLKCGLGRNTDKIKRTKIDAARLLFINKGFASGKCQ